MPSAVQNARKTLATAEAELERLTADRERLSEQLAAAETAEREIRARRDVGALTAAMSKTAAARSLLEETEGDIAALSERLSGLSDHLEREELLATLAAACSAGSEAEAKLRGELGDLTGIIRERFERIMSAHIELATAQASYNATGREIITGWTEVSGVGATPKWDANHAERKDLERELQRRGYATKPVSGDPETPSGDDPAERAAWIVYRRAVADHRAAVAKAAEEAARPERERQIRAAEERERRALSATLTIPAAYSDEVIGALSTLQIRSSTEIRQRLPGPAERFAEFVRISISQPDKETARGLLYRALGQDWTVENCLFADDPQAYYLRE